MYCHNHIYYTKKAYAREKYSNYNIIPVKIQKKSLAQNYRR